MKKARTTHPVGAKGHIWKPDWLSKHPWLRTEPSRTQHEWEMAPTEAPVYIFCAACAYFPWGHKDVLSKKKKEAIRVDKLHPHEKDGKHARAWAKWQEQMLEPAVEPAGTAAVSEDADPGVEFVESPLASLVRTTVTVAVRKAALSLTEALVHLQRANGAEILSLSDKGPYGVQAILHAAAVVLRGKQDAPHSLTHPTP